LAREISAGSWIGTMHSTIARVQNVFGFFTTVAFVVAALIAATDLITPRAPRGTITVNDVQVMRGRPNYYSTKKEEHANIRFSLNADLSSLFTWNTKQVFVYVSAVWPSNATTSRDLESGPAAEQNEAVIWDTIITNPSADHLQNIGPAAMRKLVKSAKGKAIDPSRGILNVRNQKPKYQLTSPASELGGLRNVRLRIKCKVQPWLGPLTETQEIDFGKWKMMEGGVSKAFNLPPVKAKDTGKKA